MAARASTKSAKAATAATQGIMPTSTSEALDRGRSVDGEAAATKSESAPAAELAAAGSALPPGDATVLEGERLAAFDVRSNVLGSHGFVEPGGTVIVNRTDFEALKAAGVIAGEWPEQEVSAG